MKCESGTFLYPSCGSLGTPVGSARLISVREGPNVRQSYARHDQRRQNPTDLNLQIGNPMFPAGNYFGQFPSIGPLNHRNHPNVELTVPLDVTVTLDLGILLAA